MYCGCVSPIGNACMLKFDSFHINGFVEIPLSADQYNINPGVVSGENFGTTQRYVIGL